MSMNTRGVSEAFNWTEFWNRVSQNFDSADVDKICACYKAALSAEPAAQPEDSRCPPTYRREEAVKVLIGMGWTWDGKAWAEPAAQGEAVNVPGYDVGWKIRGVTAYDEAKRKGYRHPECVEAAIKAAPPAQPAVRVPEGLQSALREAAEVLQMVADSGVNLPPNWRWPLLDELSGYAYMLMDSTHAPPEGGKGVES